MTVARARVLVAAGVLLAASASTALAGCGQDTSRLPPPQLANADPKRGAQLIGAYGCGSCHTVAGVTGADGLVGPPLTDFARRSYIAGELANNPENLQRWLRNPQAVEPGVAMPDLGVTDVDARDIAAYLLEGDG
jgi:cytochrome c